MNNRISSVKNVLKENGLDAALISSIATITYLTGYSGFSKDEREAFLFISKHEQYIITDGRYAEAVVEKIPHFNLLEISLGLPLKQILESLMQKHNIKKLGVEENNVTLSEYKILKKQFKKISPISLTSLRTIKESTEVAAIKTACALGDKAFEYILKKIKRGITEKELAFELELYIKQKGADLSFPPIVAFGKNSSIPHHQTGSDKLKSNSIILLDFGVRLNNYCSDMTRTVFFGRANNEFRKIYQTVFEAQELAIEQLNNETMASQIDKTARDHITSNRYPTIPHSLGHGTGIEVHEEPRLSPNSKDKLKVGMVFSIEPGIYIRGFVGVRIEDLVVLQKSGLRLLTKSNRNLTSIE